MRILVLGAYGLIGAEIVSALQKAGLTPIGLVRSSKKAANRPATVRSLAAARHER